MKKTKDFFFPNQIFIYHIFFLSGKRDKKKTRTLGMNFASNSWQIRNSCKSFSPSSLIFETAI